MRETGYTARSDRTKPVLPLQYWPYGTRLNSLSPNVSLA